MLDESENRPRVAILDYGMGNLRSVHRAFLKAGADAVIVGHPEEVKEARALVFPGQGAIVDTMFLLKERRWDVFIKDWIQADRPFFGICLGLQALFDHSEEGTTAGLAIFPGRVERFRFPPASGLKIPHMGWNTVHFRTQEPSLLAAIDPLSEQFYFVHSYYLVPDSEGLVWATTEYGGHPFCSAIRKGNLVATQFHPEKSQQKGLQLYRNFIDQLD